MSIEPKYRDSVLAWLHLARVYSRIEALHAEELGELGLSPAQFDILSHVVDTPAPSQQELADRLLVTKGNICGLLDRMQRRGLVERVADEEDRRVNRIRPSEHGASLFRRAAPALEAAIHLSMSELEADELRGLRETLGRLDRSLRDRAEAGTQAAAPERLA